jgi:two-component system phosphate regulon sensor histidine kinase PhoR
LDGFQDVTRKKAWWFDFCLEGRICDAIILTRYEKQIGAEMTVDFLGFNGPPNFGFSIRSSGYMILFLDLVALFALVYFNRGAFLASARNMREMQWTTLALLLFAIPFAKGILQFQFPLPAITFAPGLPRELLEPSFAIFGALPWMLAAGLLGGWQAIVVGLISGMIWGAWETHQVYTPFHMALQAGVFAWLVRREYREWPGKVIRSPFASGILVGLFFGLLQGLATFVYSEGNFYDGLDRTLSLLGPILLAAVFETSVGGLLCEGIRRSRSGLWFAPRRWVIGPYNRSLAARLLSVFGFQLLISSSLLLYGDWRLAQASARELFEKQMQHTTQQVAGSVPFFIQTGRTLIRETAEDVGHLISQESLSSEELGFLFRQASYFDRLTVYNAQGELIEVYPPQEELTALTSIELETSVLAAALGIPGEIVLERLSSSEAAEMIFLSFTQIMLEEETTYVVVGWTDLGGNPFLLPLITSLQQIDPGEGFLTDDRGRILIQSKKPDVIQMFDLASFQDEELQVVVAADGTRHSVYAQVVEGYPWRVIVTMPQREVQQLAVQIAARLMVIILVVGVAMVVAIFASSRRLTRPLRKMAEVAQSIAQGNLEEPVQGVGEDEIGQFAASFEHMRQGLKARLDEMRLLLKVSQHVSTSFEMTRIIPPILEGALDVAGADLVRLALVEPVFGTGSVSRSFQAGEDLGNWSTLDSQLLDLCEVQGTFVLEHPARARAVLDLSALVEPIKALGALPVRCEDRFAGVLWLGHQRSHTFLPDEIDLLSILAGQLGIALSNVQLFQRAEQERLRLVAVLEGTPDGVIVVDRSGTISLINPAAEDKLQLNAQDTVGKHAAEVIPIPSLVELISEPDSGVRTAEVELEKDQVMYVSVSDIRTGDAELSSKVCVLWDVTHYKKLDSLKSEFVSTVSHDLRAPLTLMRGYATMLTMVGSMNDQQKEFVGKILTSVDRMASLVDNLLDLGRIEAGLGLGLERVAVEAIVDDVVGAYRPQAVNKQLALVVEMPFELEPIEADPLLLRQAVANLIENAIKYTSTGGHVTVHIRQESGKQVIRVVDTGVGIAPTDQTRIFDKFFRSQRREMMHEKGLGLGLAIVKSIAEQHGGSVDVESKLGEGSTFTLVVPMRATRTDDGPIPGSALKS